MSRRWLSVFESDLPRIIADLAALVRLESPSDDSARVSALAAWIRDCLRERGVPAELRSCTPRGVASRELTLSVARRHRRVLVLEPSLDGAAKVARKGCGGLSFRGG